LLHFLEQIPGVLLLPRRQVFPGFHALQNSFPLFRREAVKALETLLELLLLLRRQLFELGIILQDALLLLRGQVFVGAKPVAGMRAGFSYRWRTLRRGRLSLTAFLPRFAALLLAFGASLR
jgi:hypothetical protein